MSINGKLHDGSLYVSGDEQLSQEQLLCLEKLYDFNQTRPQSGFQGFA
ncbi:maltose acetyltransferase domain-containing protein [Paenibacillus filicis]|uniref:Maltose acetyltransferase domain-containing protein n=1 Tax=Paenibacillus filicis TaxID=669464 RepID=A0ABU9DPB3_9BACL